MSDNKRLVDEYFDGFRVGDHARILACLTDDVEWELPGAFHLRGKEAFYKQIENDAFIGRPTLDVTRMVEEGQVVVAEGTVRSKWRDGRPFFARFCDVFTFRGGRIAKLVTYINEVKETTA